MNELPPLGVYVHLPWCVRKCPYCDFNSHQMRAPAPFEAYIRALLEDLEDDQVLAGERTVETVFIGGGTPSLCPPALLAQLLEGLAARLPLAADAEITLEANPGAIERSRFRELRAAGINRISLGVQSFQPRLLAALGRIHDDRDALEAIDALARSGIDDFNIDLMYGLPGQTVAEAEADVNRAIASEPAHLSLYQLTLEPGTAFHRRPPLLPDEDACHAMEAQAAVRLVDAGFRPYEVSAWAQPGHECRHNLNYWTFGDYMGIGAGAHGKLTLRDGRILRRARARRPLGWLAGQRIAAERELDAAERLFEFMLNALRLRAGFSMALFETRTGLDAAYALPGLTAGQRRQLLVSRDGEHWRPSALGRRFLNDAQALFLPPSRRLVGV